MTDSVKQKAVNLEDLNAHSKVLFNKGIGNRGTCTTASATAAKAVTFGTTFSLADGATALVRFTYGISAEDATLAVTYTDSSGSSVTTDAKAIYYRGVALPAGLVQAKDTLMLKYNGTQWDIMGVLDQDLSGKADKSATVSNVSYNSSNSKIQQTINGVTTDVCSIAQGGYQITEDNTNGIDELTPVGGAAITDDNENGLDVMTF